MTVLEHLKKEHRLFEEMLELFELRLASDSPRASSHIDTILRAFLQSLYRHEEVEKLVFARRGVKRKHGRGASRKALKREHEDLLDLIENLRFILDNLDEETYSSLRGTLAHMNERLRRHFRQEEEELWPACENGGRPNRKLVKSLSEQERSLSGLLKEVQL